MAYYKLRRLQIDQRHKNLQPDNRNMATLASLVSWQLVSFPFVSLDARLGKTSVVLGRLASYVIGLKYKLAFCSPLPTFNLSQPWLDHFGLG